jgi:hypothetical protein
MKELFNIKGCLGNQQERFLERLSSGNLHQLLGVFSVLRTMDNSDHTTYSLLVEAT